MVQNSVNSIILLTETDLDKGLTAAFEVQWHRDKVKNLLCAKLFVLHVTEDPPGRTLMRCIADTASPVLMLAPQHIWLRNISGTW